MIKRINHIKGFGVFKDYQRIGDIQDFAKLNIIYGWNYSGKTTLSRIFQSFENKQIDSYYKGCNFQIEDYDGNTFTHSDLAASELQFKIFNSDFVRDNIHLEGEAFDPILIVGKESKDAIDKIAEKKELLDKYVKIISGSQSNSIEKQIDKLSSSLTAGLREVAGKIRTALQFGQSKYTVRHAFGDYNSLLKSGHYRLKILSSDKLKDNTIWATKNESDKLPNIEKLNPEYMLDNQIDDSKELLSSIPEFSKIVQYFVDNPEVADWVEKGFETINKGKDKCEYCGNKIDEERTKELMAHFSKDLKEHKNKLVSLKKEVVESKLSYPTLDKSVFYTELWSKLDGFSMALKKSIDDYNSEIDKFAELIQSKHDEPFKPITDFLTINTTNELVEKYKEYYNNLVDEHNNKTKEFAQNKQNAQNRIKEHFISKFILSFKPWEKKTFEIWLNWRKQLLSAKVPILMAEIEELESTISKAQVGARQLNTYIEKFLGRKEVKVKVCKEGENERFKLFRGKKEARHLSEGEKTAIAFSYFLTKLDEIDDLEKTIVYIDDPISSLDSNLIFQVNALLKKYFFTKPTENDPWSLNCNQLFLSTHNFEFYNLITELPKKGKPKNLQELQHHYYQVHRIDRDESSLINMPKALLRYKSEYQFLFSEILKYHKSPKASKGDYPTLMYLPNAVRRFVELYTCSRIPGTKETTPDQRAEILWGLEESKRIMKIFNFFSHNNNIESMIQKNDLICNIEEAIEELINLISTQDEKHFKELEKASN